MGDITQAYFMTSKTLIVLAICAVCVYSFEESQDFSENKAPALGEFSEAVEPQSENKAEEAGMGEDGEMAQSRWGRRRRRRYSRRRRYLFSAIERGAKRLAKIAREKAAKGMRRAKIERGAKKRMAQIRKEKGHKAIRRLFRLKYKKIRELRNKWRVKAEKRRKHHLRSVEKTKKRKAERKQKVERRKKEAGKKMIAKFREIKSKA